VLLLWSAHDWRKTKGECWETWSFPRSHGESVWEDGVGKSGLFASQRQGPSILLLMFVLDVHCICVCFMFHLCGVCELCCVFVRMGFFPNQSW
jgi:hypothetical protein